MNGEPVILIGHGVDACEVSRIADLMQRHGRRFVERVYKPAELAYAEGGRNTEQRLAARFAAKEAIFKALGTGWAQGIGWTDAEVTRTDAGQPGVSLTGRALEVATRRGISGWSLSLTHTSELAIASAIAFGPAGGLGR
ncbi:MAG: holo-ACP synthase [Planctomycetota bacterium]